MVRAQKQKHSGDSSWKEVIKKFPEANFLQSPTYGKMSELLGFKVINKKFANGGTALMIVRDAKRGRYLEIPCGPLIDWSNQEHVASVFKEIANIAKQEKCVFVRVRPQLPKNEENLKILANLGLKESPMHLAAEHTVMIDLTRSEDELIASMRRQTRYEVRRATKLGITVERRRDEDIFKEFHQTQLETARRQGFIPPDMKTLDAEREAFDENINIYVAKTEDDQPIAYGMIIKDGSEGDYYEAASTPLNRKLPGAYALLWQAMRDLKKEGYKRFNLWGIAPPNHPNHRYSGVTTFKTGFGGEVIEYVPAHDLVISKFGYLKNLIVEKTRKMRRHL